MKKNITINLYGSLYAIDEDAYNLLEKYLNEIKRYFMSRDGGDEIVDDIEHRIAELLSEMKTEEKEIFTITDIENIIRRIGNPEEMDEENGTYDQTSSTQDTAQDASQANDGESAHTANESAESPRATWYDAFKKRKLYRDPDDKLLGGVLSGLCHYFGGMDPLPWRLIFVILCFSSLMTFSIIYLILWAVIPVAVTPEDRIRMKGKEVNMQNINEEIMQHSQNENRPKYSGKKFSQTRDFFDTLLSCMIIILKIVALIVIIPIAIGTVVCAGFWIWGAMDGGAMLQQYDFIDHEIFGAFNTNPNLIWVSGLVLLTATIFWACLLYSFIRSFFNNDTPNNNSRKTQLTLIWSIIICGVLSVVFTVIGSIMYEKAEDDYEIRSHTINGIYLREGQWNDLYSSGWNILTYENCNENGKLFRNYHQVAYDENSSDTYGLTFKKIEDNKPMRVHLRRGEYFPEGTYRMEAIVSSKGPGAYVYAQPEKGEISMMNIPIDDRNNFGNLKYLLAENDSSSVNSLNETANETLMNLNPEYAKYWSYVCTAPFHHKGGIIYTGATNLGHVVGQKDINSKGANFTVNTIRIVPCEEAPEVQPKNKKAYKKKK